MINHKTKELQDKNQINKINLSRLTKAYNRIKLLYPNDDLMLVPVLGYELDNTWFHSFHGSSYLTPTGTDIIKEMEEVCT